MTAIIRTPSRRSLAESVDVALDELLGFDRGERVLVYVDHGSDPLVAEALCARAAERGRAELLRLDSSMSLGEQARTLSDRIAHGGFDVICELSEQYFYHTPAWQAARRAGARAFSFAGLGAESFIRCVGQVDHRQLFEFGLTLKRAVERSHTVRIRTRLGTDITMALGIGIRARVRSRIRREPAPYVLPPCGLLDRRTRATFLGGQLAFRGIPSSINGTAIIDGYLWPPPDIGRLYQPVTVKIDHGRVVGVDGCPAHSEILSRWFGPQRDVRVEHLCIGFHPGAQLSGKILEAERALGCLTIGIGEGCSHTDGVIAKVSIDTDRGVIQEDGSFVFDAGRRFCPSGLQT